MSIELEHSREALKEARHMLTENAKGYPAAYLNHPEYQGVLAFIDSRLAGVNAELRRATE